MAKKKKPVVGTRRTREHVIGDLAVNHVEKQILLANCTAECLHSDYGLDMMGFTFDAVGEQEDGCLLIQIKATEALSWLKRKKAAAFRIERRHLVGWLRQTFPVVLAVYDAGADRAYWIHIQAYFAALRGFNVFRADETITVHLPEANVFDPRAVQHLADIKNESLDS